MEAPDDATDRSARDLEDPADAGDVDSVLSSPADIESAGRSCTVILVLAALILLLLCVWIGLRTSGAGQ